MNKLNSSRFSKENCLWQSLTYCLPPKTTPVGYVLWFWVLEYIFLCQMTSLKVLPIWRMREISEGILFFFFSSLHSILASVTSPVAKIVGTLLMVQWLRLQAPNGGVLGSIPGQGTRSHIQQLKIWYATWRSHMLQLRLCKARQRN